MHSDEALLAVKVYVSLILHGQVDVIITVWHLLADSGTLKPKQVERLRKVCNYFENNRHRMHYDQYLAAGYPIASGVIEGLVIIWSKTAWSERACNAMDSQRGSSHVKSLQYCSQSDLGSVYSISHSPGN